MPYKIPIKDSEYELSITQKATKDLVAFDFGLIFEKGSDQVKIYVDETLQEAIKIMLEQHQYILIKVNYQSPDVIVLTE